jgi:hypothetical protein
VNAEPPKEWFEIVGRGLERHNTVATGIVEYYPVCFVIREAGNHVRGGLHGSLWGQWLLVGSLWVDRALRGHGLGDRVDSSGRRVCAIERIRRLVSPNRELRGEAALRKARLSRIRGAQ